MAALLPEPEATGGAIWGTRRAGGVEGGSWGEQNSTSATFFVSGWVRRLQSTMSTPTLETTSFSLNLPDPSLPPFIVTLTVLRASLLLFIGSSAPFPISRDFAVSMPVRLTFYPPYSANPPPEHRPTLEHLPLEHNHQLPHPLRKALCVLPSLSRSLTNSQDETQRSAITARSSSPSTYRRSGPKAVVRSGTSLRSRRRC